MSKGALTVLIVITCSGCALFSGGPSGGRPAETAPAAPEDALRAIARGETPAWAGLTPEQAAAIHVKAEAYLKRCREAHLPDGYVADIWWKDFQRSAYYRLEGIGDSACWNGHYLAAMAMKYSVQKDQETLDDILYQLDKFDVLLGITGRDGYVARYAGPADSEPYRLYYSEYGKGEDPARPGLGKRAFLGVPPYEHLVWLGWSSRDTYDGTVLGFAATWQFVDVPEVRARVKGLVARLGDRIIADDWQMLDGKGNATKSTPRFKLAVMRLLLSVCPERFSTIQAEYDQLFEQAVVQHAKTGILDKYDDLYFPNNLNFARVYTLCILETDRTKRSASLDLMRRMYQDTADHLNAYFAAMYLSLTGDEDENARAVLDGMLLLFPEEKWYVAPDRRADPSIEKHSEGMARYALLPSERRPWDFLWQRSPCELTSAMNESIEYPGIDMFLPYWMARAAGLFPAP